MSAVGSDSEASVQVNPNTWWVTRSGSASIGGNTVSVRSLLSVEAGRVARTVITVDPTVASG